MNPRRDGTSLPDDFTRLVAPQERFEALRRQTQMHAGTTLCDLAYANPYDRTDPAVVAAIHDALDESRALALQYTPYGGATIPRRLVAGQLSRMHRRRFHYRDVLLTPGAMAALNIVFRSLDTGDGRDEVIVITPCWMDYPLYLAQLGLRAVMVPVDGASLHLDLKAIRAAISPRTRAVILSQPANPTGVTYTREELSALTALLQAEANGEPLLISDECHRDVRFGGAEFVSPVELYARTVIVHSFGKSLGIQGQRIGFIAVSPDMRNGRAYASLLVQLTRAMGFCTPTSLMQLALPRLIELRPDLSHITARRARAIGALRRYGYELAPSDATFFIYPKAPGGDDWAFAEALAARGVLVMPSSLFHHAGHFRLSLTATDAMLDAALPILAELGPAVLSGAPAANAAASTRHAALAAAS